MPPDQVPGRRSRLRQLALDTRPLSVPAYRRTLAGQGASFVGTMVTEVAVPVQIYADSHSSLYVGLAGLAGLVPITVFGLYGGAVADAVDRRRLYLWSSLVTWAVTLMLLAQALLGLRSVGLLLALVVVQSGGFAVSSSTRGAIIPSIVPTPMIPAANTLSYTVGNIGQILGPLVAGVLVGLPHGFAYAYGADALLFTTAVYSTFRLPSLRPVGATGRAGQGGASRFGLRAVAEGIAFIGRRPILLMSFALDIAAMTLAMPRALFPEAAAVRFHGGVGLLYSSIAIGSILAGLCSGWIGRVRRQGVALTCAVACCGRALSTVFLGVRQVLFKGFDRAGVGEEVLLPDDLAPAEGDVQHRAVAVDPCPAEVFGVIIEADCCPHLPGWPADEQIPEVALQPRGDEVMQERFDRGAPVMLAGPPVRPAGEHQNSVVSEARQQRMVVAGVERGQVTAQLDQHGPAQAGPGQHRPGRSEQEAACHGERVHRCSIRSSGSQAFSRTRLNAPR